MESILTEARADFIAYVETENTDCDVLEIKGSGSNISTSEKTVDMEQVQTFLRSKTDEPTFKFVTLPVTIWSGYNRPGPRSPGLAWIPDIAAELGFDPYFIRLLAIDQMVFQAVERKTPTGKKLLKIFANCYNLRLIASYDESTKSTVCIVLVKVGYLVELRYMTEFLKQNKAIFQSPYLIQSSFLIIQMDEALKRLKTGRGAWGGLDENNLLKWEVYRNDHRWGHRCLSLGREVAVHLRERLDACKDSDGLSEDVAAGNAVVRDILDTIEPWIPPVDEDFQAALKTTDDYMSKISRAMLRQDTTASIELAKLSVELTKAAKADSSSMKVIAVMTMIFLPGTFFAALFAVPSLKWDNEEIVGDKFWVYWAFTVPFTLFIISLWLAITQRSQVKSLVRTGKEQWLDKSGFVRRYLGKEKQSEEEEATKDA